MNPSHESLDFCTEIKLLCEQYDFNMETLGRLMGVSVRTIAYWKSGKKQLPANQQRFTEIKRLFDALSDTVIDAQALAKWLRKPNRAFQDLSPLQVIERGESDRIWRMLWELGEGNLG